MTQKYGNAPIFVVLRPKDSVILNAESPLTIFCNKYVLNVIVTKNEKESVLLFTNAPWNLQVFVIESPKILSRKFPNISSSEMEYIIDKINKSISFPSNVKIIPLEVPTDLVNYLTGLNDVSEAVASDAAAQFVKPFRKKLVEIFNKYQNEFIKFIVDYLSDKNSLHEDMMYDPTDIYESFADRKRDLIEEIMSDYFDEVMFLAKAEIETMDLEELKEKIHEESFITEILDRAREDADVYSYVELLEEPLKKFIKLKYKPSLKITEDNVKNDLENLLNNPKESSDFLVFMMSQILTESTNRPFYKELKKIYTMYLDVRKVFVNLAATYFKKRSREINLSKIDPEALGIAIHDFFARQDSRKIKEEIIKKTISYISNNEKLVHTILEKIVRFIDNEYRYHLRYGIYEEIARFIQERLQNES